MITSMYMIGLTHPKEHLASLHVHRAQKHHTVGIYDAERQFGHSLINSAGRVVPIRWIGEQHVREDCQGRIPSLADWLGRIQAGAVDGQWPDRQRSDADRQRSACGLDRGGHQSPDHSRLRGLASEGLGRARSASPEPRPPPDPPGGGLTNKLISSRSTRLRHYWPGGSSSFQERTSTCTTPSLRRPITAIQSRFSKTSIPKAHGSGPTSAR